MNLFQYGSGELSFVVFGLTMDDYSMTTLKITVDNRKNAQLLSKLLKSMAFVKKVEEDLLFVQKANQVNQFE